MVVRHLLAMAMVVVMAACAGPLSPTIEPSATPSATPSSGPPTTQPTPTDAQATAGPTPDPSAPPLKSLLPGSAVEVAVDQLEMHDLPGPSSPVTRTVVRGDILVLFPSEGIGFTDGPTTVEGHRWYAAVLVVPSGSGDQLPPLPESPVDGRPDPGLWGWVRADSGGQPSLTSVPPRCPTVVNLANVSGMLPAERLACFEDEPIVLRGTYGCGGGCGGTGAGTFEPEWLASPLEFDYLSREPWTGNGPLALHFAPSGPPRPEAGSIIRVTAHVDDPRAARCEIRTLGEGIDLVLMDAEFTLDYCRERLVVDSYEVLGTDPEFVVS